MDPLSICVSILAILGATTTTIKKASSIYNAPEKIDSLLNDLSEAEITVYVPLQCYNRNYSIDLAVDSGHSIESWSSIHRSSVCIRMVP